VNLRLLSFCLFLAVTANIALSQINTFPNSESFEQSFTTGDNVAFITNWTGNDVNSSSRIFQGSDARTGSSSLNVIPTSTFSGEILISLDLTGINNPKMVFYAFSKQNGSSTSTRPALLSFSTSIDGGSNFLDDVDIGDETTFPNDNTTSYTEYEYELPVTASGQSNVIIKMTVARGSGSGSSAEFVMDDVTIDEQLIPLAISSVTASSSSSVVVTFNQEVTQSTAETIGNYAIDNSVSVTAASRTSINEVTLTTSTMANNNYTLTVNGVEDAASNTAAVNLQDTFSFIEALSIASTTVTSKNTIEVIFNLDLDQTSAEALANYSIDNSIGNPTAASLDAGNNKKVTLTLGTDLTENNYTLTVNGVTDNSALASATNLQDSFSYLPLVISSLTANSATELQVTFNQAVEATGAATATNYSLNFSFGNPTSAVVDGSNAAIVTLTFGSSLVNNTYQLTVDNVANTSGNATAAGLTADVTFATATSSRQIVINEIYADPSGASQPNPQVLPGGSSQEFIELYNASTKDIDLADFDLSGGTINSHVLAPGAFVILTSSSNVTDYQAFGNTVAVTSWNSLTNSGEQLILKDNLGNIVDSLTYDLTWYQDDDKADGGWTLEQINPELICSDANNWIASTDARGGSPGSQNSVFDNTPDTTGPNLISVSTSSSTTLLVTFDEIMDQSSLTNGSYTLDNGLTVNSSAPNTPSLRSTTLTLSSAMTSGTIYQLTVTGVTDCAGNAIASGTLTFLFDNEAPVFQRFVVKDPQTVDLIFDEDLAQSPAKTDANYSVDQSIGNPSNSELNSTDNNRVSLSFTESLSESTDYTFTYDNLTDTLGNTVATSMETLNFTNAVDTVIVNSSQLLDVYFTEAVEQTAAEAVANYSVDDGIGTPKTALQDDDDAKLVHLVFENSFDDNRDLTISFEDIRDASSNRLQALNTVFVYDTDRPGIDSVVVVNQTTLTVYFDEAVDLSSAEAINNYSADNDLGNPTTASRQSNLSGVQLTFGSNFTNELVNTLSISGIKDLAQNELSSTRNEEFVYDMLPPSLSQLKVLSPTEVELTFSEVIDKTVAETLATYSIDNAIGNPTSASRSARDSSIVNLVFNGFGNNATNTLTISGMKDLNENVTTSDLTETFSSNQPMIGSLIALTDTTLSLQMTKDITQTSAETLASYSIDNGLNVKSTERDATDIYQVLVTLDAPMTEDATYNLSIASLTDTDGNTSIDQAESLTYDSQLASLNLVNENTLELSFDNALEATSAETVTNYSVTESIGNPVSAVLDNTDSKKVTLIFGADLLEGTNYELNISGLQDSFGDDITASAHDLMYDVTAPSVQSISSSFTNQITVTFSEDLDETSAETLNHFSLDNAVGTPSNIELQSSGSEVLLTFATDLTDATLYQLTIDRVEDLNGNALSSVSENFTFSAPVDPDFRDLVINEIYPDPDALSPLPNAEFIEIYNSGTDPIKLRDFTLSDNSSTATLDVFELAADDYLILTASADTELFTGNVMGLSSFPSLSNTGETIYFKRRDGTIIDSLSYDLEFYNDESKQDGGYTIELINPGASCFDPANYTASTDSNQGTPGAQNSVFDNTADTTAPEVSSVTVVSEQQLQVSFNESMDVGSIQATDFVLSSGETVSSISLEDEFGTSVLVNLATAFEKGVSLTLTVSNLTDCAGNDIATNAPTFFLGATPAANELVITEIMANPTPSQGLPEVEYLEVYNASTKILSLDGLKLSDRSSTADLPNVNVQPGSYLLLTSSSNTSEFSGIEIAGVSGFPSLNTSGDSIAIANGTDLIFDMVYDTDLYGDETKAQGGFSLEIINPSPACYDNANWTATTNTNGGTPGLQNSVFDNTPDTTSPEVSSVGVVSEQQLRVIFNESMDAGSIQTADFIISSGETVSSISLEDEFGTSVLVNLATAFEKGVSLTLTVSNLTDCAGNDIAANATTFFLGATPAANELVITEIMANPTPSQGLPEVEYLEVYNASTKILSLDGLTLSDRSSSADLPDVNVQPGSYLLLTSSNDTGEFSGIDIAGVSSFPSLNTSGDSIAIANGTDLIFDIVYDTDLYGNETKAQGGFSLEIINPSPACYDNANWTATTNANGGTPGVQNSVFDDSADTTAPEVSNVIVVSEQQLRVTFNESMDVGSIQAADFVVSSGETVSSISQEDEFGTSVLVNLATAFEKGVSLTLTVSNLTDCAGNDIATNAPTFFLGATPAANELVITEIMANPTPSQGLPEVEYLEVYNASTKILSLDGLKLSDRSSTADLPNVNVQPGSYLLLTSSSNTSEFSGIEIAGVSGFPSLNTSGDSIAIANGTDLIFDMVYDTDLYGDETKAQGGFSLEIINPSPACYDNANWTATTNTNGGTPGLQNSVFDNTPDTTSPEVSSVGVVSEQQLRVIFNESMDAGSIQTADFIISSGETVSSISLEDEFGTSVLVNLATAFEKGVSLTLTVSNLTDCAGNDIAANATTFFLGATPAANELVITEIMANPTPSQGLPEVEYLEVYNASTKILSLDGLTLSDRSSSADLPDVNVQPGSYLLLTSSNDTGEFSGIDIAGVSSFPSLNTSGDSIAIANGTDLIFDIVYDTDLYGNETKAQGGFSLEIINPSPACYDNANWTATTNANGGTPGVQNSVFDDSADTTAPEVSNVIVVSEQQLRVTFNESMDVGSIQAADFVVSSGETVSSISQEDEFGTSVLVNLATAFEKGVSLTLMVSNLTDCAGNDIATNAPTFFLGATPAANELVITEIMANPTPSQGLPEVEYLEVYNTSTKILTLDGLTLSDRSSSADLPDVNVQPGSYLLLTSSSNTGEFSAIEIAGVSSFPSLNTSGDSIAIANGTDLIFDIVYDTDFYRDEIKAQGGFSLEIINPSPACYDNANWTATTNANGGTPGVQNSVFDSTADTTAPLVTSVEIIGEQQFKIIFNESMDVSSIEAADFTFSNGLQTASVSIQTEFGTEILLQLNSSIPRGSEFDMTISGVSDCSGNEIVSSTQSFVLGATPLPGQLIITEIMADPLPSQGLPEVDYVEILNTSNITLNLQGLTLSDRSSSTPLSSVNIAPGAFAVLTTNEGAGQLAGAFGISGFPSLNSSGDLIAITEGTTVITTVTYSDDWFRDNQKAEGGVALEMIDINFPCLEAVNWRGSDASIGGTPGTVNSVAESNPDLIGPKLIQAVALNSQQVMLTYDEKLRVDDININSFQINNGITVNSFFIDETDRIITLTTNESFDTNILYTITTETITDCSGNIIMDGFDAMEVVLALEAEAGDLLINEILFNPRSGGVRFVEVYNNSTKFLNLKNWILGGSSNERIITEDELIVAPGSFQVLTTDGTILANEYPGTVNEAVFEMSSLPSFANSEGTVFLQNAQGLQIDLFDYSADFHSALLDNVDGVSLERIRFAATTNDPNNWQSASSTTGFATPGYANSQAQQGPGSVIPDDAVVVEPRSFAPDVAGMAAFTTINFEFDNPGNVINLKVYDANGQLIKDIAQNALIGTEGFFRWDGTRQNGSKARVGYYMILMEVIAPDGTVSMIKERVALGTQL